MNKKYYLLAAILIIFGVGLFLSKKPTLNTTTSTQTNLLLTAPARQAEINGYIISAEGNEITVANEMGVKEITEEEKAKRQAMSQEERQALKAQESANMTKENITLSIPVGVNIVKGSGDSSGANIKASMSEMVKGIYISVWQDSNSNIEFVKLKGVSQ